LILRVRVQVRSGVTSPTKTHLRQRNDTDFPWFEKAKLSEQLVRESKSVLRHAGVLSTGIAAEELATANRVESIMLPINHLHDQAAKAIRSQ
jgi:hypothetical protein